MSRDETRVITAEVGGYALIVLRSSKDWYLDVINKGTDRPGNDPNALNWQDSLKNVTDSMGIDLWLQTAPSCILPLGD